jgi:intracellular septation protein
MSTPDTDTAIPAEKPKHPAWLPFAIDFGPLLIFFVTYRFTRNDGMVGDTTGAIVGTAAFMVTILIALAISHIVLKKISPMLWLSAILVVGFGALTIYFNDKSFIQIKPTIIYVFFAAMLLGGWLRGKSLLKILLQAAYDGLDNTGWLKLSRNWGLFFGALAIFNEVTRAMLSFESWLSLKVWGVTGLSFVFVLAQIPMLMKHGLSLGDEAEETPAKDQ